MDSKNVIEKIENAFQVLDLPVTTPRDDIKRRYREYVKKYHPDNKDTRDDEFH